MSELPPELTELPEADEAENKSAHRKSGGALRVLFGGVLVANTLGLVYVGNHVFGSAEKPLWVSDIRANSQRIEKMESTLATVQSLRETLDELAQNIERAKNTLRAERTEEMAAVAFRMNSLDERMDAYDEKLADLLVVKSNQRKVATTSKPKRTASVPQMQLVSLRSAGGYELVSLLNTKGEQSPLLRNGDAWQGWVFVRADNRTGTFRVNGREVTLVL